MQVMKHPLFVYHTSFPVVVLRPAARSLFPPRFSAKRQMVVGVYVVDEVAMDGYDSVRENR